VLDSFHCHGHVVPAPRIVLLSSVDVIGYIGVIQDREATLLKKFLGVRGHLIAGLALLGPLSVGE
jgi:hypothetical protein